MFLPPLSFVRHAVHGTCYRQIAASQVPMPRALMKLPINIRPPSLEKRMLLLSYWTKSQQIWGRSGMGRHRKTSNRRVASGAGEQTVAYYISRPSFIHLASQRHSTRRFLAALTFSCRRSTARPDTQPSTPTMALARASLSQTATDNASRGGSRAREGAHCPRRCGADDRGHGH